MRRREFIAALCGTAAAWPFVVSAQQSTMPAIGFLHAQSPEGFADQVRGFRQGLKEAGFVEGENLAIEYRWAENRPDQLGAMAADLIHRRVALIAAFGNATAAAA